MKWEPELVNPNTPNRKTSFPDIEWLDFKFLFLYAMSPDRPDQIPVDCGSSTLEAFPWRVDRGKKLQWLKMIRDVDQDPEVQGLNPRLDAWVSTRVGGGDPFLGWITAQLGNPEATFHSRLSECLIPYDKGVDVGVVVGSS